MGEGCHLFTAVQHELEVIANDETPRNLPKIHLPQSLNKFSVIARYKVNLEKLIFLHTGNQHVEIAVQYYLKLLPLPLFNVWFKANKTCIRLVI